MPDAHALAARWAELWPEHPHRMVDEIYAPDLHLTSMAHPHHVTSGAAELHALETRLAELIPQHRNELLRVVAEGDVACIESTIVGPTTGEHAPACVWWWLDRAGRVAREVGWFDWSARTTDAAVARGTLAADDGRDRGGSWYRARADRLAELWSTDPLAMVDQLYAPDCTVGRVGQPELVGRDALRQAEQRLLQLLPVPDRWFTVHEVVGAGGVLAVLFAIGDRSREARGTVVLTLDGQDLVCSDRVYWDWATARPRGHQPA